MRTIGAIHFKDTRCIIHRTTLQTGERQDGGMSRFGTCLLYTSWHGEEEGHRHLQLVWRVAGTDIRTLVIVAMTFFLTMPGVPFIYYGDEIGMKYQMNLPNKEGSNERSGTRCV